MDGQGVARGGSSFAVLIWRVIEVNEVEVVVEGLSPWAEEGERTAVFLAAAVAVMMIDMLHALQTLVRSGHMAENSGW